MNFEGNLLVINTNDHGGAVIENPELRTRCSKQFIVGTSVVMNDEGLVWTAGSKIWVALDNISTITEVTDAAEYRNRLAIHRDGRLKNSG